MLQNLRNIKPFTALIIGLALMITGLSASAEVDPPGRVGRLSYLVGAVQIYNQDTAAWENVSINRPVTTGDIFYTPAYGRAEIRVGSIAIRLSADTEMQVVQLDDNHVDVQLDQGRAAVRLLTNDDVADFSLNTPEGQTYATQPGNYSFDSFSGLTAVTAWKGKLEFNGVDGLKSSVQSVERAEFENDNGIIRPRYSDALRDEFYAWVADRNAADDRAGRPRYVSSQMTGAEDLQAYGYWDNTPEYGAIWYPTTVVVGWAPYRYGHWAWIAPWGWTWVDDAPWGFAPFHYGRWVQYHERWCWTPGRFVARPVYAPALVAWIGTPGFSLTISSGPSVGWFPLGPREVYVPYYHVSPTYVRNVNYTHVTNITNITINNIVNNPQNFVQSNRYAYRNSPQAVTVVSRDVMVNRKPVAAAAEPLRGEQWKKVAGAPLGARPDAERPAAGPRAERAKQERGQPDRGQNENRQSNRPAPAAVDGQNQQQANPQVQNQNRPDPAARPDHRGGANAQDNNGRNNDRRFPPPPAVATPSQPQGDAQAQSQNRAGPEVRPDNRGHDNARDNNPKSKDRRPPPPASPSQYQPQSEPKSQIENRPEPTAQSLESSAAPAEPGKPEQRTFPTARPAPNRPSGTDVRGNVNAVDSPRISPAQPNAAIRNEQISRPVPAPDRTAPVEPANREVPRAVERPVDPRPVDTRPRDPGPSVSQRPVEVPHGNVARGAAPQAEAANSAVSGNAAQRQLQRQQQKQEQKQDRQNLQQVPDARN